jgi:hypothetical protein
MQAAHAAASNSCSDVAFDRAAAEAGKDEAGPAATTAADAASIDAFASMSSGISAAAAAAVVGGGASKASMAGAQPSVPARTGSGKAVDVIAAEVAAAAGLQH